MVTVKHEFVNPQDDGADDTITRPSDWNADHVDGSGNPLTLLDANSLDPIYQQFGAPDTAFEFNSSSLTGLTAMGSPDTEAAHTTIPGHYYVADNDAVQVGRYLSATPPFTAICKITEATLWDNYKYVGLFGGVATPGRFQGVYIQFNGSNLINVKTFTGPTDTGPGTESVTNAPYDPGAAMPIYLGIKVNSSTNVDYYYARAPGVVWYPIALARNPLATIASVGISVGAYAGTVQAAYDFLRVWNSAKTFPAFS